MHDTIRSYGPVPLRLMLAAGFLYHGLPKFTAEGHQAFAGMLQGIGVPSPEPVAWFVAGVEVVGAILMLLGLLVRLTVVPLLIHQVVALVTVHWPSGFNAINITGQGPNGPTFGMPGYEFNLLYIAILTALLFTGAGRWSLDALREEPEEIPREPALRVGRERAEPVGV